MKVGLYWQIGIQLPIWFIRQEKYGNKKEREKFLDWLWDFEFNLYKIPVPTKVFFLNMPPEYSLKLIQERKNKITNEYAKDIHEKDKTHIIDSYNSACSLIEKYGWHEIKCIENGEIRTIENIHEEIYSVIKKYL